VSRPTVDKYIAEDDFNAPMPVMRQRPSKLDDYKSVIDGWLDNDRSVWHKQRHTATRIFDRLVTEHGYCGSYSTVRRYVKDKKAGSTSDTYLDLVWPPATAQVDFGEADFNVCGQTTRMHYLVISFPFSNVGFPQAFFGETAECVCQGLSNVFHYLGGVPSVLVFDNATGVGKRICEKVRLTELFSRFKLHYRFEARFCNPNSGHEKGNVENKVGTLRRNMFVPVPEVYDIEEYNAGLLNEAYARTDAVHYRKGESLRNLFMEDACALEPLPTNEFAIVRYERYKTDKYANVCVEGNHRYSTVPGLARSHVLVCFYAFTIEIRSIEGVHIATHRRLFGSAPQESIDHTATLGLLLRRPGAWMNSAVRAEMPVELRDHIDARAADKAMLKSYLRTLSDVADETDYECAVEALWATLKNTGRISASDCMVYAMRIHDDFEISYDDEVDLACYDEVFSIEGVPF
jgi:transposase